MQLASRSCWISKQKLLDICTQVYHREAYHRKDTVNGHQAMHPSYMPCVRRTEQQGTQNIM